MIEENQNKKIVVKRQRNGLFLSLAAIVGVVAIFCRTIVLLVEILSR